MFGSKRSTDSVKTENTINYTPKNYNNGKISVFFDLYIDLLGTLVPGLMTLILGGALIFWSLFEVRAVLFSNISESKNLKAGENEKVYASKNAGENTDKEESVSVDIGKKIGEIFSPLHWEISTVILVSSYVIGSVFFRQDPKVPDAKSALFVWIKSHKKDRGSLAVQSTISVPRFLDKKSTRPVKIFSYIFSKYVCRKIGLDAQFPYSHLRCYLAKRQLSSLATLIPWCPQKPETEQYRTKMFVNIIKIRLLSLNQSISKEVIRNEAHVRLATSVWYAATTLRYISLFVMVALLFVFLFFNKSIYAPKLFLPFSSSLLLIVFCILMKYHLINCLHYMRVREVIYVLESARIANKINENNLFDDFFVEKSSIDCSACSACRKLTCLS